MTVLSYRRAGRDYLSKPCTELHAYRGSLRISTTEDIRKNAGLDLLPPQGYAVVAVHYQLRHLARPTVLGNLVVCVARCREVSRVLLKFCEIVRHCIEVSRVLLKFSEIVRLCMCRRRLFRLHVQWLPRARPAVMFWALSLAIYSLPVCKISDKGWHRAGHTRRAPNYSARSILSRTGETTVVPRHARRGRAGSGPRARPGW